MIGHSIAAAVEEYAMLGLDTVPTQPDSNIPLFRKWPQLSPAEMWAMAQVSYSLEKLNISFRCGGEYLLCFIDADNKNKADTSAKLERSLAEMGLYEGDYPKVRTKTFGFQYCLRLAELLPGHYKLLHPSIGAGEIRYGQGAVVLAPPSRMNGQLIELESGDFRQIPLLKVSDILHLFADQTFLEKGDDGLGKRPSVPRRTKALLQGRIKQGYSSRSEYEHAAVVGLVNKGFDFPAILELFLAYPAAGKFMGLHEKSPDLARRWLERNFESAVAWVQANESRERLLISDAIEQASQMSWKGRTGSVNRALLLAHLQLAHNAAKLIYAASARDLAEIAAVSHKTATKGTKRLIDDGWLQLVKPAVASLANVYKIKFGNLKVPLPTPLFVREWNLYATHDAFRHGGLGKPAAEIYEALLQQPATVKDLQNTTGRAVVTIKKKLNMMSNLVDLTTGEIVCMVKHSNKMWQAIEVDLDHIAQIVGTAGTGKQQQQRHQRERARHKRQLLAGRFKNPQ